MNKLSGKVAVVTGASKGIGASIAEHLAAEGASVVVNYASSKAGADAVVNRIKEKGGKAIAVQGDVSLMPDVQRLFAETKRAYGRLDILVNNAGFYQFAPLEAITPEHIQAVQCERRRPAFRYSGSREANGDGGRLDRQHRVHRWSNAGSAGFRLQRDQSCCGCDFSFPVTGARPAEDPGELARSGHGRDGRPSRIGSQRRSVSRAG